VKASRINAVPGEICVADYFKDLDCPQQTNKNQRIENALEDPGRNVLHILKMST
jgi:hypothetical protein